MNAAFFDTNILAYAADTNGPEPTKRDTARALLQSRTIVVSTQVMIELYAVMRRKLHYGAESAFDWVSTLRDEKVIELSAADVLDGLMLARRFEISHFDALILQAATRAGLDVLYTEDLNHGQTYGSVRVCNPFIEDFLQ
ncbi:MAG: PIN domain-containing protein [Hyphomonadaceae bacterium]|nr:PIN domain-containing protein [Hyphomonadaceae bacterium]